jgi:hypothetical protein
MRNPTHAARAELVQTRVCQKTPPRQHPTDLDGDFPISAKGKQRGWRPKTARLDILRQGDARGTHSIPDFLLSKLGGVKVFAIEIKFRWQDSPQKRK